MCIADNLSTGSLANIPAGAEFIEVDISDADGVRAIPRHDFSAILHIAGQASGEKSFDDPVADLDANARSTVLLSQWALERGIPTLIHASSMGVYGSPASLPVVEDTPCEPVSWYGASKLAAERALAVAHEQGLRTMSLRMFSVYGPGQNLTDLRQGMASIFLAMLRDRGEVEVRGALDRIRDFVYIDDCVDAWMRALESDVSGVYNVGSGVGTSVGDLIRMLVDALGLPTNSPIHGGASTPGDQRAMIADVSAIKRDLGWTPRTDLQTGIRSMVGWATDAKR